MGGCECGHGRLYGWVWVRPWACVWVDGGEAVDVCMVGCGRGRVYGGCGRGRVWVGVAVGVCMSG